MQRTNMETGQRRGRRDVACVDERERRHEEAVIEAEVRRLMRAVGPFGVLRRDALERAAGARYWPVGFDQALRAAVEQGRLEARAFGFYREARPDERAGRAVPAKR